MSARLEALFYPEGSETLGRRWLLAPLGLAEQAFRAGVALRTAAYARGWARPARVEGLRIVSVGNLTVGGAGKTPVVRALAERLVASGESVAILSRGYGRLAPGELRVEGPRWPSADVAGDEPLMLARSLPGYGCGWGAIGFGWPTVPERTGRRWPCSTTGSRRAGSPATSTSSSSTRRWASGTATSCRGVRPRTSGGAPPRKSPLGPGGRLPGARPLAGGRSSASAHGTPPATWSGPPAR